MSEILKHMKKLSIILLSAQAFTSCIVNQDRVTCIPAKEYQIMEAARQKYDLDIVGTFVEGMAIVGKSGYFGFIDETGEIIIPIRYQRVSPFSEGMSMNRETWSFLGKNGEVILSIPQEYKAMGGHFSDGLVYVLLNYSKYGYMGLTGELIIPADYEKAEQFSEGMAVVAKGSYPDYKYGFIDKEGKVVIPLEYDGASDFSDGLAWVKKENKWGLINKEGQIIIPFGKFEPSSENFPISIAEGLIAVRKGNKYGYINKKGEIIIPLKYENAYPFSQGLGLTKKNGKCGYINIKGEVVIPHKFEDADNFRDGLAWVGKDHLYGRIDKKGNLVDNYQYPRYEDPFKGGGIYKVWTDKGVGFIDTEGHFMLDN